MTEHPPLLSICIPTYNREQYLDETLASIINQLKPDNVGNVEICISDNASTDNTAQIVAKYKANPSINLVYSRNEKNLGADANYLKAVEIASGTYCWLLGSDDKPEPTALQQLLGYVCKGDAPDIFILESFSYDSMFSHRIQTPPYPIAIKYQDNHLFTNSHDFVKDAVEKLGYLSLNVVKRQVWLNAEGFEPFIGSAYVHTYKILKMISKGSKVLYIREPLVGWRSGNDSFMQTEKLYGRIKLDVDGYGAIAANIFGKGSYEHKKTLDAIIKFYLSDAWLPLCRLHYDAKMNWAVFRLFLSRLWRRPLFWVKVVPWFLMPRIGLLAIRYIYRRTLKPLKFRKAVLHNKH